MRAGLVLAVLCTVLVPAGPAGAQCPPLPCPPSASNSTLPAGIQLVGTLGGVPDPSGEAVVILRDDGNSPVPNVVVELDFSTCYAHPDQDIWLALDQPFEGVTLTCQQGGAKIASAVTNEDGRAVFRLVGAAHAARGSPGITTGCVVVRANGQILTPAEGLVLGAFDLNGAGGANGADLGLFLDRLFGGYVGRVDYNGSRTCSGADLSRLLAVILAAGSLQSAAQDCPD